MNVNIQELIQSFKMFILILKQVNNSIQDMVNISTHANRVYWLSFVILYRTICTHLMDVVNASVLVCLNLHLSVKLNIKC